MAIIRLDGIDDYLTFPVNASTTNYTARTFLMLFKPRPFWHLSGYLMEDGYWTSTFGSLIFGYSGEPVISMYLKNNAGVAVSWFKLTSLTNRWTQYGYMWDGTNAYYVLNGVKYGGQLFGGTMDCSSYASNWIGSYHGTSSFADYDLAAVFSYRRGLSDAELLYNYQHPDNPVRRGANIIWTQESLYGGQWTDLSGNANHGTFAGTPRVVSYNNLAGRNSSV